MVIPGAGLMFLCGHFRLRLEFFFALEQGAGGTLAVLVGHGPAPFTYLRACLE